jgi:hypothetical protein
MHTYTHPDTHTLTHKLNCIKCFVNFIFRIDYSEPVHQAKSLSLSEAQIIFYYLFIYLLLFPSQEINVSQLPV